MVKKLCARDLVHRDVKTENLILQLTGQLKMIDFGVACIKASTSEHVWCGTPWAGAPEVSTREGKRGGEA
jgi:serine/threonine protein kinase